MHRPTVVRGDALGCAVRVARVFRGAQLADAAIGRGRQRGRRGAAGNRVIGRARLAAAEGQMRHACLVI